VPGTAIAAQEAMNVAKENRELNERAYQEISRSKRFN